MARACVEQAAGAVVGRLGGLFLVVLCLVAVTTGARAEPTAAQSLRSEPLAIETADGTTHEFTVEIAATPEQQQTGLMFRKDMAPDHGMLFEFAMPREARFWMKNTYLPLDLLFIRSNGRIANIAHGEPLKLDAITSRGRVAAVLELNAGTAERLGIAPGDLVRHPFFNTAGDGS
ncbi:MAG: DUF192 domain-containing protein [Rhodothalassiaceae bacterium]